MTLDFSASSFSFSNRWIIPARIENPYHLIAKARSFFLRHQPIKSLVEILG
jgi:hypothetical protein